MTLPLETVVVQLQTQQTQLQSQPKGDNERTQTQPKGDNERRSAAQLAGALWRAGPWKGYWISCALTLNPALTTAVFDALKARCGEMWGDMGRCGEMWGGMGSYAVVLG